MALDILYYAALGKNRKICQLLKNGCDVNATNDKGESSLYCAVKQRKHSTVKLLLGKGANVRRTPLHGESPLMAATMNNDEKTVKLLLSYGADWGNIDDRRFTLEEETIINDIHNLQTNQHSDSEEIRNMLHKIDTRNVYYRNDEFKIAKTKMKNGNFVTVKILINQELGSDVVMKEANVIRCLRHPNIVQCVETLTSSSSGTNAIIFESVSNKNLMEKIHEEKKKFTIEEIINIGKEISLALLFLHSKHIVHNFLNSISIYFSEYDTVKLSNFQYAISFKKSDVHIMSENMKKLHVPYVAPEIINEEETTSPKQIDIYSFGCLFWEMIACKIPWSWLSYDEIRILAKVKSKIQLPSQNCWPEVFNTIISCTTTRIQSERLENFEDVLDILNGRKNDVTKLLDGSCRSQCIDKRMSCISRVRFDNSRVMKTEEKAKTFNNQEPRSSVMKHVLSMINNDVITHDTNVNDTADDINMPKRMIEISPSALHTFQTIHNISETSMTPLRNVHQLFNIANHHDRNTWGKQSTSVRELQDMLFNLQKKGESKENIRRAIRDYFQLAVTSRHVLPVRQTALLDSIKTKDERENLSSQIICKIFDIGEYRTKTEWAKCAPYRRDSTGKRI